MGGKPKGKEWRRKFPESWQRLFERLDRQKERDPVFRAHCERASLVRRCRVSHAGRMVEDRDVHGSLGYYCGRCGVSETVYWGDAWNRRATMTCDEILAEREAEVNHGSAPKP
jgi:hypothetical protein